MGAKGGGGGRHNKEGEGVMDKEIGAGMGWGRAPQTFGE